MFRSGGSWISLHWNIRESIGVYSINTHLIWRTKMLKKWKGRRVRAKGDINITPLIDILLVLLVIFMTITPLTPVGFRTNVPQEPPPDPQHHQNDSIVILSMDSQGVVRINQKVVDLASLSAELKDIFKMRNDKTAFVQADEGLLFSEVAQIIDAAKASGVDRIGLMGDALQVH